MKFDTNKNYTLFNLGKQKLKEGDKVLLVSKEKVDYFKSLNYKSYCRTPLFVKEMFEYCNQIATITWINTSNGLFTINLDRNGWTWHLDYIEKIVDN